MAKLFDVKGYWDMSCGYNFNEKDRWEGKFLLEDDGWFEGIAVDPNSSYQKDRFIFGVYHKDKVIELFKFTPIDVSAPFAYHCEKKEATYEGTFDKISLLGTSFCGISFICTQDAEALRGDVSSEVAELKARIKSYKDNMMDAFGKCSYRNVFTTRKQLSDEVLRFYEQNKGKEGSESGNERLPF